MNLGSIRRVRSLIILLLDFIFAVAIFSGVYYFRLNKLPEYWSADLWLIVLTFITTLYLSGTYFKERSGGLPRLPIRTFFVVLAGGVICVVWVYLLGPLEFRNYFGRGVLPVGTALFGISTTLIRFGVNRLYHFQESGLELLYIGFSKSSEAFMKELQNHSEVRGLTLATAKPVEISESRVKQLVNDDPKELLKGDWQAIIIDPEHQPNDAEKATLISLRLSGTPVISLADYYERNWFMVPVHDIGDDWFLRSQGFSMLGSPISNRIKRLLDVLLSTVILIATIPVLMLCAILIKLSSKGPVLFRQTRVGFQGKTFTIYKLRTMRQDAEVNGAQWASSNDPRITSIGSFLRKARLDEIPQCWNVLRGDMSFVGPRPERPEFTGMLSKEIPYYDLRHTVKPGITGWAQVIFPYGASAEDALKKLQYELYYIKNQSLLLDLNIIIRTTFTVFQRAGR